jgi:hypothetical protein
LYYKYAHISFTNRCVAIFSKYYKYFFTTKIFEEDSFLLEKSLSNIEITNVGFFFKNKLYFLSLLNFYKHNDSLSLFKPLIPLFKKAYIYLGHLFITIINFFYFFMYFKSLVVNRILYVYIQKFFINNGYY